jgi:hypothetical protein
VVYCGVADQDSIVYFAGFGICAVATTMRADTRQEIEQSDISKAFKVNTKCDG